MFNCNTRITPVTNLANSDESLPDFLLNKHTGHSGGVNSVAVSPDGKQVVSASFDQGVKLWNAQTGECITTIYAALPQHGYASINEAENRITHASKEAWRYFRYEQRAPKIGKVILWPTETFEELS